MDRLSLKMIALSLIFLVLQACALISLVGFGYVYGWKSDAVQISAVEMTVYGLLFLAIHQVALWLERKGK
jgi:hypothetical protein